MASSTLAPWALFRTHHLKSPMSGQFHCTSLHENWVSTSTKQCYHMKKRIYRPVPQRWGQIRADSNSSTSFDKEAYEAERLRLDADAREAMMIRADAESRQTDSNSNAWKWEIRKRIWDLMERENIAQNPRPVHHRIPNFVGAGAAAQMLGGLQAFATAKCVKVNPDSPQKQVRYLALSGLCFNLCPRESPLEYWVIDCLGMGSREPTWSRRVEQLESELAESREVTMALQIRYNGLSVHVTEESISQRQSIWQLQDETVALRQQLEELHATPQSNVSPLNSEAVSFPAPDPGIPDINVPAATCRNRQSLLQSF